MKNGFSWLSVLRGHDPWLERAKKEHDRRIAEIEAEYERVTSQAANTYTSVANQCQREIAAITSSAGLHGAPWDDERWKAWTPVTSDTIPAVTRIGQLTEEAAFDRLTMPALHSIIGGRNVMFKATGAAKDKVAEAMQSIMLRLLATMRPGKLRFVLIDPVGLGRNVASFMRLAEHDEALVGSQAWVEQAHIEEQLARLQDHMRIVIQKFLQDKYDSMESYNAQAGEVAEPYRLLVVMNFPAKFTTVETAQLLTSIAAEGPKCGVHTLLQVDTERPLPYGFNMGDLERATTVIAWNGQQFVWADPDFQACLLELDTKPPANVVDMIIPAVGEQAKDANRVEVPFQKIAPPQQRWWQADSRSGLVAPLGRAGATKIQLLEVGEGEKQHVLVAGQTGTGKTTLFHVLITNLALTYAPEELQLYLVDFKRVEFITYAVNRLPHARVVAVAAERAFGLSVLQGLYDEMRRRQEMFQNATKRYGSLVNDIAGYRNKSGERLPRILLIVDEFQELLVEKDNIQEDASTLLDQLVRQGRAFGIHVVLGSQSLQGSYPLAKGTIDQMNIRIAFHASDADSRLIMAEDNSAAMSLSRPGEAIYNAATGQVAGNNLFQCAWLDDGPRSDYLSQIRQKADRIGYVPAQPQIVFDGTALTEVTENRPLREMLATREWPALARAWTFWLGDAVAIKDPTAAEFRRQSRNNLIIVGSNEEAAMSMTLVGLVGLAAQHMPVTAGIQGATAATAARFYLVDLSTAGERWEGALAGLAQALPHSPEVARHRADVKRVLAIVAKEVERRLKSGDSALHAETIYLVLFGIQRARELRVNDNRWGDADSESPEAKNWATICREGPALGVHIIAWCDTCNNLRRLGSETIDEFDLRVALQMGEDDSEDLIQSTAAARLDYTGAGFARRSARALLYSEERPGLLEKFRPYALPTIDWLQEAGRQLRERA